MLNKENMQLSYEIDELMDRIRMKKLAKMKKNNHSPSKTTLNQEDMLDTLNKNSSLTSSIKKRNMYNLSVGGGGSLSQSRLDEKVPLLDPAKFS
jgi:hypothetical protein